MSRSDAQREARLAVDGSGLTRKAFAAKIGMDYGTLADFIDGKRWSHGPTRKAIEAGLGWPENTMGRLEAGETLAQIVGPSRNDPPPATTGRGGQRGLSDYSLAELADEIRRRAENGP